MIHAKKEGIGHQASGVRNDARFDGSTGSGLLAKRLSGEGKSLPDGSFVPFWHRRKRDALPVLRTRVSRGIAWMSSGKTPNEPLKAGCEGRNA